MTCIKTDSSPWILQWYMPYNKQSKLGTLSNIDINKFLFALLVHQILISINSWLFFVNYLWVYWYVEICDPLLMNLYDFNELLSVKLFDYRCVMLNSYYFSIFEGNAMLRSSKYTYYWCKGTEDIFISLRLNVLSQLLRGPNSEFINNWGIKSASRDD